MKKKQTLIILLSVISILLITSCVPGSGSNSPTNPAGFFKGIWHGWVAPVSLIWGLFEPNIRIYEINNSGWWYDLGFYISIISGFGGISFFRRKRQRVVKHNSY